MLFDKKDAQLVLLSCQESICAQSTDPQTFANQVEKLARVAQIFQIPMWSVMHMPHLWGAHLPVCQTFCPRPMESALFSASDILIPHLNPHREPSGACIVNASTTIRVLNRTLGWNLPTDGPKTLNGLLLEKLETIPSAGTSLRIGNLEMEILQIADNAIRTVRVHER
ncbi:MAG: hypothetical protein EBT64_07540 [Gammaproteobacteria bacterium]|nr:hypothetical protein [Gammaproteobacteria bacterium]